MKSVKKVENHIINWLKDYANKHNMGGFVVGVSGGIDSAVTSALCAKTGLNVICLEMPIQQESKQDSRASTHIKWLKNKFFNVTSYRLSLDKVFLSFLEILPKTSNLSSQSHSLANTRARFRMTSLYYFAALNKYLVAGTGNKVEDFGVGFYTKYGDGGVDISPIADLNKSQVFEMGKYLKIIDSIQKAEPTDGLWSDNRTDEKQIGASYPELEWAMDVFEKKIDQTSMTDRQKKVLSIYSNFHKQNKHKMVPIPVCEIPKNLI
tara:strand:+ start:834 stop:1625 length:792 start_codon:yes stop_codon:yes gene_type:complete